MKKNKLTIGILFIFLLLNTVNISGASVPWNEGDLYTYTESFEYQFLNKQIDGEILSNSKYSEVETNEFVIDNIDTTDEVLDLEYSMPSGELTINEGISYNATKFGEYMINFELEMEDEKYVYFIMELDFKYFLNPDDFDGLNEQAKLYFEELLKEDLDNSTTFEDFLDDADSFNFMGAKTAAEAADEFTEDRFEWSFEIDMTNVLEFPVQSDEDIKWYNYDKYISKTSLEYDKDGVLKSYSFFVEYSVITDDFEITSYIEVLIYTGTGAVASLTAPGFEIYTVISIFIVVPLINKFKKEELL